MSGHLMPVRRAGAGAPTDSAPCHRSLVSLSRWVVLLVALAALMAMHGLSDHGVGGVAGADMGMGAAPFSHATGMEHVGDARGIEGSNPADRSAHHPRGAGLTGGVHTSGPSTSELGTGAAGDQHGHHGGGHEDLMVGMCLAVLGALALLRSLRRGSRPLERVLTASVDRALASATALRVRARGAVRPDLRMLSIQRC